jgi:hypothetical protein
MSSFLSFICAVFIAAFLVMRGDREVMADLQYNSEYWAKYDTKVKDISNTVYEDFLESYGQELGLRSYGACVDLLVNRYYDTAVLALSAADSYSQTP